jgi:hypothetical protein
MKELLRELVVVEVNPVTQAHVAREFLQSRILRSLERRGAFPAWAFCGGTALRFLHGIPRWSEDLDFAASAPGTDVRFLDVMRGVKTDLEAEGYSIEVKAKAEKTVAGAFVRFRGLLHEIEVSPHASQVFSVKVEIDTNPPADAGCESTVLRRREIVTLFHHDKASLFAGKLHAVLTRPYTKGRDLFDLAWYLSDESWPEPNLLLLNNALAQTIRSGRRLPGIEVPLGQSNWRGVVRRRLDAIDWKKARDDVAPFLSRLSDLATVDRDRIAAMLGT